jgi:hypothetical protein
MKAPILRHCIDLVALHGNASTAGGPILPLRKLIVAAPLATVSDLKPWIMCHTCMPSPSTTFERAGNIRGLQDIYTDTP